MTPPETVSAETAAQRPAHHLAQKKIVRIAKALSRLSNGDLAMLRRGPLRKDDAGAPAFWLLSEWCDFPADERWATIIQAMALLTRRSADGKGHESPHDPSVPLGRALCDGNDPAWPGPGEVRPMFSELRFARLLNSRGAQRRDLLLRAVRMLARAEKPVNCVNIASFVLAAPGNDEPARRLARDYYTRLAAARPRTSQETEHG